ncbi:flavodoxin [Saccharopolyspora sp. K220]|uniref:flavodoxin family protein n=1 Tax=Saccharopolyspora soli TaxID=2926618 RepID=UPI001F590322|nr:flavodoxin [Saccharopolyspora soli]MCI2421059.1 flavodoxin [Saccharopolyspora soli]
MRALVVYESTFGNTETIAEHIAAGLERWMDVDLAEVASAPTCIGEHVGLLVVGGHAFPTTQTTTDQPRIHPAAEHRLRYWLNNVHKGLSSVHAATFDTRAKDPNTPGSATRAIEKHLRRNGFHIITEPANSFYLEHPTGPARPAEPQRAQHWAERLAAKLATTARHPH